MRQTRGQTLSIGAGILILVYFFTLSFALCFELESQFVKALGQGLGAVF